MTLIIIYSLFALLLLVVDIYAYTQDFMFGVWCSTLLLAFTLDFLFLMIYFEIKQKRPEKLFLFTLSSLLIMTSVVIFNLVVIDELINYPQLFAVSSGFLTICMFLSIILIKPSRLVNLRT